jgi:hypothetical protein
MQLTFGQPIDYWHCLVQPSLGSCDEALAGWFGGARFAYYERRTSTVLIFKRWLNRWLKIRVNINEVRPARLARGKCHLTGATPDSLTYEQQHQRRQRCNTQAARV